MPERVQGLVLSNIKFKESSLICKIYTQQHGLLSVIVSGVRSKRAKISQAYFQPLCMLDFLLYIKENSGIYRTKDFSLVVNPFGVVHNIGISAIAMFISETVLRTTKEKESDPQLFLLLQSVAHLLTSYPRNIQDIHLYFLYHYSELLGISLKSHYDFTQWGNESYDLERNLAKLINSCEGEYQTIGFTKEERAILVRWILHYFEQHVGPINIKSLYVLEDVFLIK